MRHANNRSGVTQVAKSNEVSSVSPHQGTEDRNETDRVSPDETELGPGPLRVTQMLLVVHVQIGDLG